MEKNDVVPQIPQDAGFPRKGTPADKLLFLLHYAILAPSSHNTQPWVFALSGDKLLLYADRSRTIGVLDPHGREVLISCGAALFYLRLALHHFGYRGDITLIPQPDEPELVAEIGLGAVHAAAEGEEELFHAISLRHTNRQPYAIQPVPYDVVALLRAAAQAEGAWLVAVNTLLSRTVLANMIVEGEMKLHSDPEYQHLQAAWSASGYTNVPPFIDASVGRDADAHLQTDSAPKTGYTIASQAPLLAVLGTDGDTPEDWLKAGQALSRILLRASANGVAASFLNQALEVPEVRQVVDNTWSRTGYAQIVLRLGYGPRTTSTPRNPVSEVLF